MKSPADLINAYLDINGDGIFNGIDLWMWPLLIAVLYHFVKNVAIKHNRR